MKYLLILILLIIACTPTAPEEHGGNADADGVVVQGYVSECGGPYGYDCGDFILLEKFIEVNSQIFRHYLDINENGIVDALEFGYQVWDNGRLVKLNLNYKHYVYL